MASSALRLMQTMCRRCRTLCVQNRCLLKQTSPRKPPSRYLITGAVLFAQCQTKEMLHLQAPDAANLTHEHLLKAASAQTADAVTTLLSQTAFAVIEAEKKYRDTVNVLIQLLEHHITVLGNEDEENRVWDIVLQGRARVETYKKHIADLSMLFSCVQKVVDATAEVSFLAGSEFTSTSLGERLYNIQRHVESAQEQSRQIDKQLQEVQAHCIQVTAEHAEKEEKRKRAEDEVFGVDLSGDLDLNTEEEPEQETS